jgi:[acyl-carrier-protein] S-malonyltransferase
MTSDMNDRTSDINHQPSDILLCPGQGAQQVGMGKAWFDAYPVAAQTFGAADQALGYELSSICFEGPAETLNRTDVAQAAIYVTSVAGYQALVEDGALNPMEAAAGLSLGEFTALHLAGAFDFHEGLELVRLRGEAMQAAAEQQASGMVALVGADEQQANELCDRARGEGVLVPANFNCPGQVVVSGSKEACDRAIEVAEQMELRATPLNVAGAFHSPLMQSAADKLAEALEKVHWHEFDTTVLANVTGKPHDGSDISSVKQRLVEQLTNPVRWADDMQWANENLTGRYVELPPGKVLSGLMRRIDKKTKVQNHAEPAVSH